MCSVFGKNSKKKKGKKIALFKIARAREYSKSTLSHIDQTHNLKQQSALERERERETTKRKRGHHEEESRRRPHEDSAFFSRYPSESSDEDNAGGGPTTTTTTTTTTVRLCFENTTTLQR